MSGQGREAELFEELVMFLAGGFDCILQIEQVCIDLG
jgi:hypothetical protein